MCALAKETGLWLVPGSLYERGDDGNVYNTAIAVSPLGEIAATYRKVFPWQPYEQTTPGHEFVVFDIPGVGRIGLAICYDGSFPETVRQLAWLGAELIIQPTLTTTRDREMELVCARANAWTNQVFVVNVNAADPAGVGASCIVNPDGTVRQQAAAGEEVLIDCLDLDAVSLARSHGTVRAEPSVGSARPARRGRAVTDVRRRYQDAAVAPPRSGRRRATAAHQLARTGIGGHAVLGDDLARDDRRDVAVSRLVEPAPACGQVVGDDGFVQPHRRVIDHVQIGLVAHRNSAAVGQTGDAGRSRCQLADRLGDASAGRTLRSRAQCASRYVGKLESQIIP